MMTGHYYRSLAFPEEIIHEILDYNLRVTHTEFFGPGCYETINRRKEIRKLGAKATPPCSAALLVSKRWLRIGTPILYESIKISTLRDTKAVLAVLRANEGLGKCVRRLRLEGGYGQALGEVAKYLYNVEHLFILPDSRCRESVTGLHILFPALNLRTLKIEDKRPAYNRNTDYINGVLQHSIKFYWPNLKQIALDSATNMATELLAAIQLAPTVEEFVLTESLTALWMNNGILESILENPAVKRIICHDERFATVTDEYVRERLTLSDADKAKLQFVPVLEDAPLTLGPLPRVEPEQMWNRENYLRNYRGPVGGGTQQNYFYLDI